MNAPPVRRRYLTFKVENKKVLKTTLENTKRLPALVLGRLQKYQFLLIQACKSVAYKIAS